MANICLISLATLCLFNVVACNRVVEFLKLNDGLNFAKLENYLNQELPGDSSAEANLALLKNNLHKLKRRTRGAAEALVELSGASDNKCDEHLLSLLIKVEANGLRAYGLKRTETVIQPHLRRILESCSAYMDTFVEQRLANKLASGSLGLTLGQFIEPIKFIYSPPVLAKLFDLQLIVPKSEVDIDGDQIFEWLQRLAQGTGLPVNKDQRRNKADSEKYLKAFKHFLVEPCKELVSTMGIVFDGINAVAYMHQYPAKEYLAHRSALFMRTVWAHKACQLATRMSRSDKLDLLGPE